MRTACAVGKWVPCDSNERTIILNFLRRACSIGSEARCSQKQFGSEGVHPPKSPQNDFARVLVNLSISQPSLRQAAGRTSVAWLIRPCQAVSCTLGSRSFPPRWGDAGWNELLGQSTGPPVYGHRLHIGSAEQSWLVTTFFFFCTRGCEEGLLEYDLISKWFKPLISQETYGTLLYFVSISSTAKTCSTILRQNYKKASGQRLRMSLCISHRAFQLLCDAIGSRGDVVRMIKVN